MNISYSAVQLAAINSNAPRILTIAGPGSGKTRTLVGRIERLLKDGADPEGMVIITFTNAGAKELLSRLSGAPQFGFIGTLHGFCLRELQNHSLNFESNITVLDEEQATELLMETAAGCGCKASLAKLQAAREKFTGTISKPEDIAIAAYLKNLRRNSAVDFDSILSEFLSMLYQRTWRHLFVDEHQDSGVMDAKIYESLKVENRFFVGDPDQSIYGFRKACVQNILSLSQNPEWQTIYLTGNYRCTAAICAAANNLIQYNRNRAEKLTSTLRVETGEVQVLPAFPMDDAEMHGVLARVEQLIATGTAPEEIAILARRNSTVSDFVTTAEAMGMEIRKKKRPEVPADWPQARAALELLNAPYNTLTVSQWLRVKHGKEKAAELKHRAAIGQNNLWQLVPEPITLGACMRSLPEALARLGISRESITAIMEKAAGIPDVDFSSLSFALARDSSHSEELGNGVTITTIHGAKGREWRHVYLVAWEQQVIPGTSRTTDIEEERRIAFVGITRAQDFLTISYAQKRRETWGRKRHAAATPTRFLLEIN